MNKQPPQDIIYIEQPIGSWLCGQACVAMVCHVSLKEATNACGSGGTGTDHILCGLRKFGIHSSDRMVRYGKKKGLPKRGLLRVRYRQSKLPHRYFHWSVYWGGWYFDPLFGISPSLQPRGDAYITSYMSINH